MNKILFVIDVRGWKFSRWWASPIQSVNCIDYVEWEIALHKLIFNVIIGKDRRIWREDNVLVCAPIIVIFMVSNRDFAFIIGFEFKWVFFLISSYIGFNKPTRLKFAKFCLSDWMRAHRVCWKLTPIWLEILILFFIQVSLNTELCGLELNKKNRRG